MSKKTKAFIIGATAVLLVLGGLFFNSDIWEYIRYRYDDKYVPQMIESVLISKVSVEDGELLPEEELKTFFSEFNGEFEGHYDDMPESLRRLTDSFVERVNIRYESSLFVYDIDISVSEIMGVRWIMFLYQYEGFSHMYSYAGGIFNSKTITYAIANYQMQNQTVMISYAPHMVLLYKGTNVAALPTADFDEYMHDTKEGKAHLNENLSMKRIEKYIASKRKSEAKTVSP